ncbi:MAG: glycolate oxidase subunit GlcF [Sedimenticola sp.]
MQTSLPEEILNTPQGQEADRILRSCVHCGFCTATCPTYQLLGDELDGPRGRIYLIKQLLEGGRVTERTQRHLDRCLTCRACETTCPSGVRYARLLDIGRQQVAQRVGRPTGQRLLRWAIRKTVPYPGRFALLLRPAQWLRPLLPERLRRRVPVSHSRGESVDPVHPRRMLVLEGCAQSVATPGTNAAAARVLNRLGISLVSSPSAGCCGAVDLHMGAEDDGLGHVRRNIDAWWPEIEAGAEAVVITASGCGAQVKEYGELLGNDPEYAEKARRISEMARDLGEVLIAEDLSTLAHEVKPERVAVHCPCTLQHAQQLPDVVEQILERLGFDLADTRDKHLCCGSAGTYSILQPEISSELRSNKLKALTIDSPDLIVTANVGCQLHLSAGSDLPVSHWIELLDRSLDR